MEKWNGIPDRWKTTSKNFAGMKGQGNCSGKEEKYAQITRNVV